MNRQVIYYRPSLMEDDEHEALRSSGFLMTDCLTDLHEDDLVICRYSLLPFTDDVYREIRNVGATAINNFAAINWIADLGRWAPHFGEMTPHTWDVLSEIPNEGPFILKGGTNSKKHYWNTHMYAANKKEAITVYGRLAEDGLIGCQPIYIRKFEPLVTYLEGINGMPVTKEFRCFFYKSRMLCHGFYWHNYIDDIPEVPVMDCPISFITDIMAKMENIANFYVVDIGQKVNGEWIVIELNAGEMSGLACCDPGWLYDSLYTAIEEDPC